MEEKRIVCILYLHKEKKMIDIDVPLNISANELIVALKEGFKLDIDTNDLSQCYLQAENPTALLKGNKTLEEYGLRDGTIINYTA
jgi:uncharacterized ubiquitin-like protein YukD